MSDSKANPPVRPSLDDDDIDPRYATESYQHQTSSAARSQSNANSGPNSNNSVVFDAAAAIESQQTSHAFPSSTVPPPLSSQLHHQQQPAWSSSGPPRLTNSAGFSQSFNTSQSWSLSSVCALAWAVPPFSSVLVLVWETESDLARFHAYQSGICGVALILALWLVRSVLGLQTLGLLMGMAAFGWFWVCGSTAHKAAPSLARNPYLPHVGDIASRWVGEE